MRKRLRWVVVPLAAMALMAIGGCGGGKPGLVKVSGTIKYSDGTPVQVPEGGRGDVGFRPVDLENYDPDKQTVKGAGGRIDAQGHYEMGTFRGPDGVIPGKYKVVISVLQKGDDPATALLAEKFADPMNTPLEITVDKARTDADFVVEKR